MKSHAKNLIALALIIAVAVAASWAVGRFHKPGHLGVLAAQAMDMSQMRPPVGAAPVALASVRTGSLSDTVTYTGTVQAYNEQDISTRITGTILSLSVYPGDLVRAGEVIARLDSAEVSAKTRQADAQAREAQINAQVAQITHHLHHGAALGQAQAQLAAAQQSISGAEAGAEASQSAVSDTEAGVQSAQAGASYWKTEIPREKQLANAGAASQQEYQNELAQAQAAFAAVSQAAAKASQAKATARAAQAQVIEAHRQADVALAGVQMAQADIAVAQGQAQQAGAGASAMQAAAQEAAVVQGYTRVTSPAAGVVIDRPIAPGTLVQSGTVILKVAEIDRVRVQASVATADLSGIGPGSSVVITTQNGSRDIAARVTAVFPSASMDTRTATVEAIIPNPGHRLLPGAYVSMQIAKRAAHTDQLLVPASAIVSQGGQSSVWIIKQAGTDKSGPTYECVVCHIRYTAAQAKKFHYRDPMEGGKLIPLKHASSAAPNSPATAHEVPVQAGGTDGTSTEVTAGELTANDRVVAHGQAGLTEGARILEAAWGPSGPKLLPSAASAGTGQTVYRCETCGMTYSEADARKNHFIDPMDGGKLVAAQPGTSP